MKRPFVKHTEYKPHAGLTPGQRRAAAESGHLIKLLTPIRTQKEVAELIGVSHQAVQKTEVLAIHKLRVRMIDAVRRIPGLESEIHLLIAHLEKRDTRSLFERCMQGGQTQ
ncbi:MAG: hypothetical protein V1929_00135 [bacterium]